MVEQPDQTKPFVVPGHAAFVQKMMMMMQLLPLTMVVSLILLVYNQLFGFKTVHCSKVGQSLVFPPASRLLTCVRSRDFSSTPLDHYLILGQQVVFQPLELQKVPISPQRLSSLSYQQVNYQRTWALNRVKLTTDPAASSTPIQMFFVLPGLTYMTTYHKDQVLPGLLET